MSNLMDMTFVIPTTVRLFMFVRSGHNFCLWLLYRQRHKTETDEKVFLSFNFIIFFYYKVYFTLRVVGVRSKPLGKR
jgi:hypothetical protein